jgi:hypothetical protein
MKDFTSHFRQLAESLLPDDSRILTPAGGPDVIILCTWRLIGDTHRPNKRSRMIRIVIAQEALEDYARGSEGARLAGDARFLEWLGRQLSDFDPNHDSPLGVDPPPVTWPLSTLELNG